MMRSYSKDEEITAYVTKYALTKGIIEAKGRVLHSISSDMFSYETAQGKESAHGNDWHKSLVSAFKRAHDMRMDKIVSLKKNIAKLEALEFKVTRSNG